MITLSSSAGGCEGSLGVSQLCFLGRGCEVEGGPSFQQKTDTHASWETSSAWNGLTALLLLPVSFMADLWAWEVGLD